jgi:predicted negative regulator of RcsB-dependent stress response
MAMAVRAVESTRIDSMLRLWRREEFPLVVSILLILIIVIITRAAWSSSLS